jgi:hypothetical protein
MLSGVRGVRVQNVEIVEWMTLAVAVGEDMESGEVVTFAMPKDEASEVLTALERDDPVILEVGSLRVLRARLPSDRSTSQ